MKTTDWLATETGESLLRQESKRVRLALESIFGDQYLQIGAWGGSHFCKLARTKRKAVVDVTDEHRPDIVMQANNLAIANESIDIALLPHMLESHEDPHGVLRELDRVLRADGYIVILGFNPVSVWGLRHLLSRRRFPPGSRRLISEHRLRDWLRLLNFSVDHSSFHYFPAQPLRLAIGANRHAGDAEDKDPDHAQRRNRFIRALRFSMIAAIEAWRRHAPFAGCYMLVARKALYTPTMIEPAWKKRPRFVGQLANPTTRNAA